MKKLLSIEYAKIRNYRTFWVLMSIYAVLAPLTFIGLSFLGIPFFPPNEEIYSFPTIWNYITWCTSIWNIILGVVMVILVCNEINYKTMRQNVIDGVSKRNVILSKFLFLVLIAMVVTLYTFVVALLIGSFYSPISEVMSGIEYLGIFFIQTVGYFTFAFMFAVLVKRSAMAIIFYCLTLVIFAPIVGALVTLGSEFAGQVMPTSVMSDLTPFPFFREQLDMIKEADPNFKEPFVLSQSVRSIIALGYITLFVGLSYFVLRKRDL